VASKPRLSFLRTLPPFPVAVLATSVVVLAIVGIAQDFLTGLVQVVVLLLGVWSSYALGQRSDVRPHARKAYRRAANLYGQLYALTERIAVLRDNVRATEPGNLRDRACDAFDFLEFAVGQNLSIVSDAMEDWEDVVPEEAAELRRTAKRPRTDGQDEITLEGDFEVLTDDELLSEEDETQ
jgi:hypothetical protein